MNNLPVTMLFMHFANELRSLNSLVFQFHASADNGKLIAELEEPSASTTVMCS